MAVEISGTRRTSRASRQASYNHTNTAPFGDAFDADRLGVFLFGGNLGASRIRSHPLPISRRPSMRAQQLVRRWPADTSRPIVLLPVAPGHCFRVHQAKQRPVAPLVGDEIRNLLLIKGLRFSRLFGTSSNELTQLRLQMWYGVGQSRRLLACPIPNRNFAQLYLRYSKRSAFVFLALIWTLDEGLTAAGVLYTIAIYIRLLWHRHVDRHRLHQ